VIHTKTAMNVSELRHEQRFETGIDLKLNFEGRHSFMCCPLMTSTGTCMGVLQVRSRLKTSKQKVREWLLTFSQLLCSW
jgi:hypothetical protein